MDALPYGQQQHPQARASDAPHPSQYRYATKANDRVSTTNQSDSVFIWTSILLLSTLMVVPIWNATALLMDQNYVFWAGRALPGGIITACIVILLIYVATILGFFRWARPSVRTDQTLMMIANMFITLFGLTLLLLALPLSRQASDTYTNLMHRCDYSEQTHHMYEYWTVLHNIRTLPACAELPSVEECDGYAIAPPYTTMLKTMEEQFHCSGFCWKPEPLLPSLAASNGTSASASASSNSTSTSLLRKFHHRHHKLLVLEQETPAGAASPFPASLFSKHKAEASCEGMAARDIRALAGDIGYQTFYQGIYLVVVAILTGFLKLVGFCLSESERDTKTFNHL